MASTFPEVRGKNLAGQLYLLPKDFEGELNLIFLAFQREQQLMVNTWLPTADLLESIHPGLRYYELPTISRRNPITRWLIDAGMRSGISDPKARRKTITLYLDKGPFCKALGIPDEETINILLLNKKGEITWKAEGSCNVDKARLLSDFVKSFFAS